MERHTTDLNSLFIFIIILFLHLVILLAFLST